MDWPSDEHAQELAALREEVGRLRSIFSRTTEAVFCWALVEPVSVEAPIDEQVAAMTDTILLDCNEVAAVGYGYAAAAEILGRPAREIWQRPPPNQDMLLRAFCEAGYELSGYRLSVDYPDGSTRVFENDVFGVIEDGKVLRTWGAARDVTERVKLEGELVQAQKLDVIGRLAGAVAHDFNNLLTAIIGSLDLLRESPGEVALLEVARGAADRSAKLTRRMLGLSRHAVVQQRVIVAARVIADAEALLARLLAPDLILDLAIAPEVADATAFIDETHLEQVVLNLVVNARDALREQRAQALEVGGELAPDSERVRVSLDLDLDGRELLLCVADRGPGMSKEVQARMFEPFFTTKGAGEGTGLGLDTVRRVVEGARGRTVVDSAPGQGCRVTVYLPRCTESLEIGQAARARKRPGAVSTIVVVDDDPVVRSLVGQTLRREGYDAREFDGAAQALAEMHRGESERVSHDLVITDVQMRGRSGPSFVRRLRKTHPVLPVLYISGFSREQLNLDEDPWASFLAKPFGRLELLDAVAERLAEVSKPGPAV